MAIENLPEINWTILFSTITICLSAMATLIKVFGNSCVKDEALRRSDLIKDMSTSINQNRTSLEKTKKELQDVNEKSHKDYSEKIDKIKDDITDIQRQVERLKVMVENNSKTAEELKKAHRDVVNRLDEVLRQIMETLS